SLEVADEGTYTFNLVDGKAKGTTSLVLIGEFKALQKKSQFERAEWLRKQPHFIKYLDFTITPQCDVLLQCTAANMKADTEIIWYKDSLSIGERDEAAKKLEKKADVLTFNIGKISKSDAGIYEVYLRDERGQDKSRFDLTNEYQAVMNELFRVINSSSQIQVTSTEHGIVLSSDVTYYHEDQRINWLHDAKIAASERVKAGVTGEQLWVKINDPTEKDKGKYAIDLFDGKDGVKRVFELSG
uniref:Ig-like domain-containing protein n=1 Tax=Hippocampus comes TaxID=109280 RepID=A0A3Q2Z2H2_HIPCM